MNYLETYLGPLVGRNDIDWEFLSTLFRAKKMKKGETIFERGQTDRRVGIICKGLVEQTRDGQNPYNFEAEGGVLMSFESCYLNQENSESTIAVEDCLVWISSFNKLQGFFRQSHQNLALYTKLLEKYYGKKVQKEAFMAMQPAYRVNNYQEILDFDASRLKKNRIARFIGLTPESFSRLSINKRPKAKHNTIKEA